MSNDPKKPTAQVRPFTDFMSGVPGGADVDPFKYDGAYAARKPEPEDEPVLTINAERVGELPPGFTTGIPELDELLGIAKSKHASNSPGVKAAILSGIEAFQNDLRAKGVTLRNEDVYDAFFEIMAERFVVAFGPNLGFGPSMDSGTVALTKREIHDRVWTVATDMQKASAAVEAMFLRGDTTALDAIFKD